MGIRVKDGAIETTVFGFPKIMKHKGSGCVALHTEDSYIVLCSGNTIYSVGAVVVIVKRDFNWEDYTRPITLENYN